MAKNFFLVRIKIDGKWHERIEYDRGKAMDAIRGLNPKAFPSVEEACMFECVPTYLSYSRASHKPFKLEGL